MKNKNVAFVLNFLLPGAGFLYLSRARLAAINLGAALAVGLVLGLVMPEAFWDGLGRYLATGIGGGSGAWAMLVAEQMNAAAAEAARTPTLDDIARETRLLDSNR